MSFEIPAGLTELLQDFTVDVLRRRPADLYQFAAEYFREAKERRSTPPHSAAAAAAANFTGKKGVSFGAGGPGGGSGGNQEEGHVSHSVNCRDEPDEEEEDEDDEEFIGQA